MEDFENFLPPPSHEYILTLGYWEYHQAAFILTQWPLNLTLGAVCPIINKQLGLGVIYMPNERLNKKMLSKDTNRFLAEMKVSIENGELNAYSRNLGLYVPYGRNVSYIVSSLEAIIWALLKGFILPEVIQDRLNLKQMDAPKFKESQNRSVKNQVIGQFLLEKNSSFNVSDLLKEGDLMKKFGSLNNAKQRDTKKERCDLNKLYCSKGNPGAPNKNSVVSKNRDYIPGPIPQVVIYDDRGVPLYNFRLLWTVIETVAKLKIDDMAIRNQFYNLTEKEFIKEILVDSTMRLYIDKASQNVLEFVIVCILRELGAFYSPATLKSLPDDDRKKMSVGALMEAEKKFYRDLYAEEEVERIEE